MSHTQHTYPFHTHTLTMHTHTHAHTHTHTVIHTQTIVTIAPTLTSPTHNLHTHTHTHTHKHTHTHTHTPHSQRTVVSSTTDQQSSDFWRMKYLLWNSTCHQESSQLDFRSLWDTISLLKKTEWACSSKTKHRSSRHTPAIFAFWLVMWLKPCDPNG